jgi:hypothetical protein
MSTRLNVLFTRGRGRAGRGFDQAHDLRREIRWVRPPFGFQRNSRRSRP